jgi:uncharacterized protein YodC (DUF2158 family)
VFKSGFAERRHAKNPEEKPMAQKPEFKVGDRVTLSIDWPDMLVDSEPDQDGKIWCIWREGGKTERRQFHVDQLIKPGPAYP